MKNTATSRNLTSGSIIMSVILTALPMLAGQLLQNLYTGADSIIVGRFVGKTALAAVSSCGEITRVITNFFVGLSAGAGVLFGRCFGSGDREKLSKAIHTALPVAFLVGSTMSLFGILFAPSILTLVRCPDDVRPQAIIYLRVYLIGVALISAYNILSGVLRSVGDSKTPFKFLCVSCTANILLDLLLVVVFQLDVLGVALATVISQTLSVSLIIRKMVRSDDVYHIDFSAFCFDSSTIREIIVLGLPAGLQSCIIGCSNLLIQRYTNSFASAAMAGVGAAKKLDALLTDIAQSLALATTIFIAQNIGAKKYKRAICCVYKTLIFSIALTMLVACVYIIFPSQLISLFSSDPDVISYGAAMLKVVCPLYWIMCINQSFMFANRAFGKSLVSMCIGITGNVLARQLFLYISMGRNNNISNIYFSGPVGWAVAGILNASFFLIFIIPKYSRAECT